MDVGETGHMQLVKLQQTLQQRLSFGAVERYFMAMLQRRVQQIEQGHGLLRAEVLCVLGRFGQKNAFLKVQKQFAARFTLRLKTEVARQLHQKMQMQISHVVRRSIQQAQVVQ